MFLLVVVVDFIRDRVFKVRPLPPPTLPACIYGLPVPMIRSRTIFCPPGARIPSSYLLALPSQVPVAHAHCADFVARVRRD